MARHPRTVDAVIAIAFTLLSVSAAPVVGSRSPGLAGGVALAALSVLTGVALMLRRSRPVTVLAVSGAAAAAGALVSGAFDGGAVPLALYALAVYGSARHAWIGFGGVAVLIAVVAPSTAGEGPMALSIATLLLINLILPLIATLIGINVGGRKRYVEALRDLAVQLARERDQQARLATAAERTRIAREIHDIVAHGITVMVTLADGAAASAVARPELARDAMREVAETGRTSLSEMRRMLGVLAEEPGAGDAVPPSLRAPQPGHADLAALVDSFRSTGLPVRFTSTGTPPDDPGRQLAVFRVVQESLTNVLRYAPNADRVEVKLDHRPEEIIVEVTDDDLTGPVVPPVPGSGRGLVGVAERMAVYGGTATAGRREAGGWRVLATMPSGLHDVRPGDARRTADPIDRTTRAQEDR
ncbi:two-component sensor histidine kinase [Clavibacter michiganensis subsp. michiganensis]|nr:histidine kinase [Clavibacter michiganensis]MWJ20360.1 two-component sensor histidine kinase [Clavibacter michiganensis subsp. michiganensis]OUD99549.1 Nitrate/nitrite sensor protein NarX [Clavibacter michiganensis subsp. michiganensis]OUE06321.1 Nitrate/nitrite sensor protein NarX [Clavibacter michiganensis subsp. michiganensis]